METDSFWNIRAQGRNAEIDITGVIGNLADFEAESTTAIDFIRELRALGRGVTSLNLNIHSEGGSVRDGMAIYRAIREFPGQKIAHVPALAGSIATVIALAADRVEVGPEAFWVVHNPRIKAAGDQLMMQHAADVLGKTRAAMLDIYERRTGGDRDHLGDMMDAETWLRGAEIKEAGFADVVKTDQPKMRLAAQLSPEVMAQMKHAPEELLKRKPAPVTDEQRARLEKLGIANA